MRHNVRCTVNLKNIAVKLVLVFAAGLNSFDALGYDCSSLLNRGDQAMLAAPEANFRMELERLKKPVEFTAQSSSEDPESASELADLRAALQQADTSDEEA